VLFFSGAASMRGERGVLLRERGLLGRTPRTATVTAREPGLLFAMDGSDFLALVAKHQGVAERLMALYELPVPLPDAHPGDDPATGTAH